MINLHADDKLATNPLANAVLERTSVRVQDCYQCGKCSAGCPIAPFMDLTPRQVLRAVQLGQAELALGSKAIWLCSSCQTCSTRCPMELDLARVMDSLRQIAVERGVRPGEKDIVLSNRLFLESVRRLGRLYEVGVLAALNLGSGKPLANVFDVGLPLIARGKINPLPARAGAQEIERIFEGTRER